MKKTVIILILFLLASELFSQNYFNFPTANALWNYKIAGSTSSPHEWTVIDSLGETTTIGDSQYVEIYKASKGTSNIIGAIREDALQKRIYFHNFTNEIVLYDFNLKKGDTIFYSTNLYYNLDYYKVVDSIDSIMIS